MKLLSSALFWRILLSSLLVVAVLGFGLNRAASSHEELESQFDRLVQHDLKLADDAEVLLRLMSDLETGKRGYLLNGDRTFLLPYNNARRDLEGVLAEAQSTAEPGLEDERVSAFSRLVHEWIDNVSEPQIRARDRGDPIDSELTATGKAKTDQMRDILTDLRNHALFDARTREDAAFQSVTASRRETTGVLVLAIVIALASGVWIARDLSGAASRLEDALVATGNLEPMPHIPDRRDELGAVGRSLAKMAALLIDKDSTLRSTLAQREATLADLRIANAELAARDAAAREYAEFVRELKTLDVGVLSSSGLGGLVQLARAEIGVVFLLDGAERLVPTHAVARDGRALDHQVFDSQGLPLSTMNRKEPMLLTGEDLGELPPTLDLGITKAKIVWLLAQPIAVGDERAGAVLIGKVGSMDTDREQLVKDASRQLALALHNAWTHARLTDKSVVLAEQGETLARANRVKTEFLASMSHELRTPLNAILGFADLLLVSPRENLSPRARESLERIKRNGEHLLTLINDVLDLAKAESGRVDVRLEAIDVAQLVRACAAEVDSLRRGKDLSIVVNAPPEAEMVTDGQRVRQILINLLSNAIKFTDKGEVTVTLTMDANDTRLSVADTGIGIPERSMKDLFKDFQQLDAGDGRRHPGTGIGLALSRRLARALGGDILVVSHEGKGSTFTAVLPRLARVPAERSEAVA